MSSFLQLQQELAEVLGENGTGNGFWSQSIKQRFLNLGVLDVMIRTRSGPLVTDTSLTTTVALQTYTLPSNFLAPRQLYVDGERHRRIDLERELELLGGDLDDATLFKSFKTSDIPKRFYRLDLTANTFSLLPIPAKTGLAIKWFYLKVPTTLSADADIPNIPVITHHLPALWAGWKLAYRDKDQAARGAQLRDEYLEGVRMANEFLNAALDDVESEWDLDKKFFADEPLTSTNFDIV